MPSINLDKPLNLPADPLSVPRSSTSKNDSSDSFDDHLQRLAPQPPDNKAPSSLAQDAPRARPSASTTNSGDTGQKKPPAPSNKQDVKDSTPATQLTAVAPVANSPAATSSVQIDTPQVDTPKVGPPKAATPVKPNVKIGPTVKNGSATPQQPAPADKATPPVTQTDKQVPTPALAPTDPSGTVTPKTQTQATLSAQQPAAPDAQKQVATNATKQVVSDPQQPAVADPQTPVVSGSPRQLDSSPQQPAVAESQKQANPGSQTDVALALQTQAATDSQQEVAPLPSKPTVVDPKKVAVATKPGNVATPASAIVDEQQPTQAAETDQPQGAMIEPGATGEAKPARDAAGGVKKVAANRGNHDAADPAVQPSAAPAARGSAPAEPNPASESGPRLEGDLIAAPATAANHSSANSEAQSLTPIQAPALTSAATDSARRAPAQTAASSDGTSNISDVDRVRFVQRVSRAMQTASEGVGTLRLRLSPPELGPVRLDVSIKDGVMSARLEAETPAAKAALLDNYPKLQERLAEQNIKLEHFEVNLSDRSGTGGAPNQSFDNAGSQRDFGSPTPRPRAQPATSISETVPAASATQIVGSDQLNVLI